MEYTNLEIEDILCEPDDVQVLNSNVCPECGLSEFIEDYAKGIVFCTCGQIVDNVFDNGIERRNDDDDDAPKSGMIHNKLLPQSSLGTSVSARGRLKKLHIWNAMPYKERSDNIMFKKIHGVCVLNKIVRKIEDDAKILCKRVSGTIHKTGKNKGKPIITRGFNRSGIVAGCLFIACRRNDETRSIKEIAYYFDITERDVNKGIRSLLTILDDDSIVREIGTSKVIHFIQRKCDELHIKNKYSEMAKIMASNIDKLNVASNHTTYSLAAACILLVAEMNNLRAITKRRLSESFCGLSDVTIGKTYNKIKDLRYILTNNETVNEIHFEIVKQRNRRVVSQEVYDKMKQFNVDTSKYILKGCENETIPTVSEPTRYEILTERMESDKKSEYYTTDNNNVSDHDFMITDIKKTLKELKYQRVLNDDALDIMKNVNVKLNILNVYINDWAHELGIQQ